jgi:S-adenosylmethionine/arginine decarboxylase-like enzyme
MADFGARLVVLAISVKGAIDNCAAMVDDIVKATGMTVAHAPVLYGYPFNGKGGTGSTYIQPITESFIAVDEWPDLDGAYVIICSCKEVTPSIVIDVIEKHGPKVTEADYRTMRLSE